MVSYNCVDKKWKNTLSIPKYSFEHKNMIGTHNILQNRYDGNVKRTTTLNKVDDYNMYTVNTLWYYLGNLIENHYQILSRNCVMGKMLWLWRLFL